MQLTEPKATHTFAVIRFYRLWRDAKRTEKQWRALGGKRLLISGKRGQWRVRCQMPLVAFAKWCASEAVAEAAKR